MSKKTSSSDRPKSRFIRDVIMKCNNDIQCSRNSLLPTDVLKKKENKLKIRDVSDFVNPFLHLAMCGRMNAVDDSETPYDGEKVQSFSRGSSRRGAPSSFPLSPHLDVDIHEKNDGSTRPLWIRMTKNRQPFSFGHVSKHLKSESEEYDSDDGSIELNDLYLPNSLKTSNISNEDAKNAGNISEPF
mmetsp:Transcript_3193/g.6613  ORF Transcript_3193/g.6613 Transcript_3193/m.6613 type:complete len:186 (-) Transcript_3193:70-627(-)